MRLKSIHIIILLCWGSLLCAQPHPPTQPVHIDSGLLILIALGIAAGTIAQDRKPSK